MDIERIIGKEIKKIRANQKPSGKCLSYMDIAIMLDNVASKGERKRILDHVCTCKECANELFGNYALHESRSIENVKVPEVWVEKVKDLIISKPKGNLFEIIFEIKRQAIEIIRTTGNILSTGMEPAMAGAFRGKHRRRKQKSIKVIKTIGSLSIEVSICYTGRNLCNISLNIKPPSPVAGAKATLIKDNEEIESLPIHSGKCCFEEVSLSNYTIAIKGYKKQPIMIKVNGKKSK
jgi:hypothetical protein